MKIKLVEKDSLRLTRFTSFAVLASALRAFAAEQTLYGLMNNRLVSAVVINPSPEGITDHSTGGLMLQDMHKSEGFIKPYGV